jgi:hypothetical protein
MVNCAGVFDLLRIFFQPGAVFAHVRQNKVWFPAYAGTVFFALAGMVLVIQMAGIEMLTLQRYQQDTKLAEKIGGEGGVERAVSSSNERGPKLLVLSRVGGIVAVGLVVAAIGFRMAIGYFGKNPNFFAVLGTVSFAAFPFAALSFFMTWLLLSMVDDKTGLDLGNMPGLNFGRLLDKGSTPAAIFVMASEMDVISLGQVLMMSFGLKKVTGLSFVQGLVICGVLWAVVVLWKAAWMVYV